MDERLNKYSDDELLQFMKERRVESGPPNIRAQIKIIDEEVFPALKKLSFLPYGATTEDVEFNKWLAEDLFSTVEKYKERLKDDLND
jgi:hypothetical protein